MSLCARREGVGLRTLLHLDAQYHVLEDLVERMADVQVAIRVRRPIM